MKYPREVQEQINILKEYKVNDDLMRFQILHLYPLKLAYPDGYYDSMFFELWGFNYENKLSLQKRLIRTHCDRLNFKNIEVELTQIFADGSTLIRFPYPITFDINGQAISFRRVK